MEWLKEALSSTLEAQEMEKKILMGIGKGFVAKEDFNALNTTKKRLEEELTEAKQALEAQGGLAKKAMELEETLTKEREKAAKAAEFAEEKRRFDELKGELKWRDKLTEEAIFRQFQEAVSKGQEEQEAFAGLILEGDYFENPNPPADMAAMGEAEPQGLSAAAFHKMSFAERARLFEQDKETYERLKGE